MKNSPIAILLCAGEGTRMNDTRTNKVCYEVAGVPAIIRTINNMRDAGIERFVCVVGNKSEKVMECLKDIPGVSYAFQATRSGTGNAALCGINVLRSFDYHGPVLLGMGDKIISTSVFATLCEQYDTSSKAPVFAVQPHDFNESGGRICIKDGKVCGIYEKLDSMLLLLGEKGCKTSEQMQDALAAKTLSKGKKDKLIKTALSLDSIPGSVRLCDNEFTHSDIESCEYVNTATYIADVDMLYQALVGLNSNNAQNEIYLTDALNNIIENTSASICPILDKNDLMTYSNMSELLEINKYFCSLEKDEFDYPFASERIYELKVWSKETQDKFTEIYSDYPNLIENRRDKLITLLTAFIEKYGDKRVIVSRSPGRVNILGRHIEHRGGSINVMSINRETLVVASPRNDNIVNVSNYSFRFEDKSFNIKNEVKVANSDDWLDYIENEHTLRLVRESKGDWVNYVKASILRLQVNNRDHILRGMDMMFLGDIPPAAGLSSSSSIVVATTEAAIEINKLNIKAKEFIHLCGEGEWFVGSRGGAGDHAAMKCGKRNMITHLDFCPFKIGESVPFPQDYNIVVANSFVEAKKSEGAKDKFNQKVACYEIGFMLVKKNNPQYADKLHYLKDINQDNLGVSQSDIYRILLGVPEYLTVDEIYSLLPEYKDDIDRIMKTHAPADKYEIRSTLLYGIAECQRANKCLELLIEEDYEALGELMNISHNGDRIFVGDKEYDYSANDEYLNRLINDYDNGDDKQKFEAQIYRQPGGYACSTRIIDNLVDFINTHEGVMGSELSGAGLGGCIIILVKKDSTQALLNSLDVNYYQKNQLPMGAQIFIPVSGSLTM